MVSVLLFRARVHKLHNVPDKGGAILVSNHQSFMDPVFATMALHREGNYMARDSLFVNPIFGRLIASLNAYPVKRGAADIGAIKESLRRLKHGSVIVLFPEGTRTEDGRINPMLPGVGAIALKARVPIVPTLIDGVYQTWPKGRLLPSPGDVVIEYGAPLMPEEYAGLTADQLMVEIRRRLVAMQYRWHRRVPKRRLEWFGRQSEALPEDVRPPAAGEAAVAAGV